MKNKLLLFALGIIIVTQTLAAQVPSYVPTNGLVGYWPFNGNANDASGNGNNGTANGATLTADRYGNSNSAYYFDGVTNYIQLPGNITPNQITLSIWFKMNSNQLNQYIFRNRLFGYGLKFNNNNVNSLNKIYGFLNIINGASYNQYQYTNNENAELNRWYHFSMSYDGTYCKMYLNGINIYESNQFPISTIKYLNSGLGFTIGRDGDDNNQYFHGDIDDFGIWNRALTPQEITNLYNANQCITNITVTDTLIINVGQLSFTNPVTWANNITIAPNPASTQININFNNITDLNGGTLKIINALGQQVATTPITTSGTNTTLSLATWGGNGMYFVQIINPQGQIVDIKKIILQ